MNWRPPPGWYPEPGSASLRYWNGTEWTDQRAVPNHRTVSQILAVSKPVTPEKVVTITFAVLFGGLALICAMAGNAKAVLGVMVLAVLVGVPTALFLLGVRSVRHTRELRRRRSEYEQGLISRFDQAAVRNVVPPDAEQMRQQAWQPGLGDPAAPAVRPKNPAAWHIVTQYPTQQFRKHDQDE